MTGFGRYTAEKEGKSFTIEAKSLNSKQLDLNLRLPNIYKEKESDMRSLVSKMLVRGKVDIGIYVELTGTAHLPEIDKDTVAYYYKQLKEIADQVGAEENLLSTAMRLPEVLKTERNEIDESEWDLLMSSVTKALDQLDQFRQQEGKTLQDDLLMRVQYIEEAIKQIIPFEQSRIESVKQRISKNLREIVSEENLDKNRLEQEIIFYIEKLDITEEKVRLTNHCKYFREICNEKESQGKKLGFVAQEMGREINTIGSKANDSDIQKIVVGMKDELEKIKEQLLNIL